MQSEFDKVSLCNKFGGHGFSGFGDTATFKNSQISLSGHYSPWSSKNLIDQNRLKKFMQVGIDVKCMHTNFGGRGLSGFGNKISLWFIVVEKFNRLELAQKIRSSSNGCNMHVH